jgi:S1-C subfamily serine protease
MQFRIWVAMVAVGCWMQQAVAAPDARQAIVKVYTTFASPHYYAPWNTGGPATRTGSGCILSGKRILTNAHVVEDQTFIQIRRYSDAKKYRARVLFVSHTTDLALLAVDDDAFFEGVTPLELDGLPETQAEVTVLGFPTGGDMLSTTKGVVSRIEHRSYVHSSFYQLAGQIDAAINPGNSGGPVMVNGRVVGVVMQGLASADNIGYMVPAPIIEHFLNDVNDGRLDGVPDLGLRIGDLENPDLKRRCGLSPEQTGVRVQYVGLGSACDGIVQSGDIILEVAGFKVADDGTIEFRKDERTSYSYPSEICQVGDSLPLKIFRDGTIQEVSVTFRRPVERELLVPREQYDVRPTYYIFGGAVFCPLTKNYLLSWGDWYSRAPKNLVYALQFRDVKVEGEEVVVLMRVLADDVNLGYHDWSGWIVEKVDGRPINNLRELVNAVETGTDEFVVFSDDRNSELVMDRAKARAALPDILQRYRIPADRSEDLCAATP